MDEFRFLDWKVYQDAKKAAASVFKLTSSFPPQFKYDLGSQLNRSAISIVLNIAEGSGKESDKELNRFFNIAIGSVNETLAGLDLAKDNGLISSAKFERLKAELIEVARQLGGFKKKLRGR